jgi:hypothetical protein
MLLPERYHVPTWAALAVIAGVLAISVIASLLFPRKEAQGKNGDSDKA